MTMKEIKDAREIIYEPIAAKTFDPLSGETLSLEDRLRSIKINPGGRIAGARPITRKDVPKVNAATIRHKKILL